jgi:hypothetical protein
LFPAQFDFSEFSLANGVAEDVLAKLGLLLASRMVVPALSTTPSFLPHVRHTDYRGRRGIIVLRVCILMWLGQGKAFSFSFNVDLWLGY